MIGNGLLGDDFLAGDGHAVVAVPTGRLGASAIARSQDAERLSCSSIMASLEALAMQASIESGSGQAVPAQAQTFCKAEGMIPVAIAQKGVSQSAQQMLSGQADKAAAMLMALCATTAHSGQAVPILVAESSILQWAIPVLKGAASKNGMGKFIGHAVSSPVRIQLSILSRQRGNDQPAMQPVWVIVDDGGGVAPPDNPGGPDGNNTWVIAIRSLYMVIPDVELLRLPERIPVRNSSMQLSLDADKKDWDFKAHILGADAFDAVMPSDDGEPVMLEANINGYSWRVLVEDVGADLGARSISREITGRSLSAKLAEPFEQPVDRTSNELLTAQQIVAAALPYGWQLDWQAVDWLVPAGAWSAQYLTPIQVAKAFADAIGAVVVPDRSSQKITVQPRYPVAPWLFDAAVATQSIPGTATTLVSMGNSIPNQANAVFVHGGLAGGVLGNVYLEGTAGDRLMQTVQDNLITHLDAARARGLRLLAGQYQQPVIRSFSMPLRYGIFPLVQLGDLLRVAIQRVPTVSLGIANAVGVSVGREQGRTKVRQSVTLGEKTPNLWANWNAAQTKARMLPGTVESINGDGSATVLLVGGGYSVVEGSSVASVSVGSSVFIQGRELKGPAPAFIQAALIAV